MRNKGIVGNPQTDYQVAVRNRLSALSSAWRGLTEGQRNAWIEATQDWLTTNIFGDSITPNGMNLFVGVNTNLLNAGVPTVNVPPNKVGADALTSIGVSSDVGNTEIELAFTPTPVPANHVLVVEATAPVSPGINFFKNRYRQIAVLPTATATDENIWTAYVDKFGVPAVGKKIGVRAKFINTVTGEVSLPLSTTLVLS